MRKGTIASLVPQGQYGRIKTEDGKEAHFNRECLWDTAFEDLAEGQSVECEVQSSYRGFIAFHIRPLRAPRKERIL